MLLHRQLSKSVSSSVALDVLHGGELTVATSHVPGHLFGLVCRHPNNFIVGTSSRTLRTIAFTLAGGLVAVVAAVSPP